LQLGYPDAEHAVFERRVDAVAGRVRRGVTKQYVIGCPDPYPKLLSLVDCFELVVVGFRVRVDKIHFVYLAGDGIRRGRQRPASG